MSLGGVGVGGNYRWLDHCQLGAPPHGGGRAPDPHHLSGSRHSPPPWLVQLRRVRHLGSDQCADSAEPTPSRQARRDVAGPHGHGLWHLERTRWERVPVGSRPRLHGASEILAGNGGKPRWRERPADGPRWTVVPTPQAANRGPRLHVNRLRHLAQDRLTASGRVEGPSHEEPRGRCVPHGLFASSSALVRWPLLPSSQSADEGPDPSLIRGRDGSKNLTGQRLVGRDGPVRTFDHQRAPWALDGMVDMGGGGHPQAGVP